MTIGAVHDSTISRVRLSVSSAPSGADVALIERSADGGTTWATVRGGDAVPLVAGACQLDDYEFAGNVLNTYRVTYVDVQNPGIISLGAVSTGNNAPVTPGLPAGPIDGDILLMKAAIRNTAGTVNTPAGWTKLVDMGNFCLFTCPWAPGVVAPTVTFSGGVANADTEARICLWRNTESVIAAVTQVNAAAQNIAAPAMSVGPLLPNVFQRVAWKQDTSTLSTLDSSWVALSRDVASAGDDMTTLWWSKITSVDEPVGTFVMTGGGAAISKVAMLRFTRKPFMSRESTTITPPLLAAWLKNVQRPFLNTPIKVVGFSPIRRASRSTVHEIVGRSDAVGVTERRAGKRYSLRLELATLADEAEMDTRLSDGAVIFLHTPLDAPFPGGYYLIDETEVSQPPRHHSQRRYIDLPLIQVAPPASAVVGTTYTWQGVVNDYATWSDLIAANATWGDLLARVNDPVDVVVP